MNGRGSWGADEQAQAPSGQIISLSEVKAEKQEGELEDGFPWPGAEGWEADSIMRQGTEFLQLYDILLW